MKVINLTSLNNFGCHALLLAIFASWESVSLHIALKKNSKRNG